MSDNQLREFAVRYTAAWCSQDPASVAAFFAANGTLTINDGAPAVGRQAIAEAAESFMTAFPDLRVAMDDLAGTEYRWTLTGTHRGTGKRVRISGCERWRMDADGLIASSVGSFDAADYERQLS